MAEEKNLTAPEQEEAVQDINELRQIRLDKLKNMQEAGKDPFQIRKAEQTITNSEIEARFEELENTDVAICGRIMAWRDMGKANFIEVSDRSGKCRCM